MDVWPPTICGGLGAGAAGVGAVVVAGDGDGVGVGLLITVSSQVPMTGMREMYESA